MSNLYTKDDFINNVLKAHSERPDGTSIAQAHADMVNARIKEIEAKTDGWMIKQQAETINKLYEVNAELKRKIDMLTKRIGE